MVTISKSRIVFIFFLLTTPVAAITMVTFRNIMKKRNTEFRKEMEETSARVMEMVELVPVTRAHALEDEEVAKMSGQLFSVAEKGYKLDLIQALFGSVGWAVFQIFQVICLAFTGYLAIGGKFRQAISHCTRVILHGSQSGVLHRHPAAYHCQGVLNPSIPSVKYCYLKISKIMRARKNWNR